MVWMVVSLNVALSLLCLWVAWKLYQFRQLLRCLNRRCAIAAQATDQALHNAPDTLLGGQYSVQIGRSQVAQWRQWQGQLQALLSLLGTLQWVYQRTRVVPTKPMSFRRPRRK